MILGRKNCILVAHDWGAIIGWYFIFKYPEMIERYVVLNMGPLFSVKPKWIQLFYSWCVAVLLNKVRTIHSITIKLFSQVYISLSITLRA